MLTPGDVILLMSWRDQAAAEAFEGRLAKGERGFAASAWCAIMVCSTAARRRNTIPMPRARRQGTRDCRLRRQRFPVGILQMIPDLGRQKSK